MKVYDTDATLREMVASMEAQGFKQNLEDDKVTATLLFEHFHEQNIVLIQNIIGGVDVYKRLSDDEVELLLPDDPTPVVGFIVNECGETWSLTQRYAPANRTVVKTTEHTITARADDLQEPDYTYPVYELETGECCVFFCEDEPGPTWYSSFQEFKDNQTDAKTRMDEIVEIETAGQFDWLLVSIKERVNESADYYSSNGIPESLRHLIHEKEIGETTI